MAQTSDRVSKVAAKLSKLEAGDIFDACHSGSAAVEQLAADVRSVAASALRQDETKGIGRFFKRPR
jgi:hypothetical protein